MEWIENLQAEISKLDSPQGPLSLEKVSICKIGPVNLIQKAGIAWVKYTFLQLQLYLIDILSRLSVI